MKKLIFLFLISAVFFSILGCETLPPPTPKQIVTNPFGTSSLKIGMAKEEVISIMGEPDEIFKKGRDELGTSKEEWVYYPRWPVIPVNRQNLSRTNKLTFAGNNLVGWEEEGK